MARRIRDLIMTEEMNLSLIRRLSQKGGMPMVASLDETEDILFITENGVGGILHPISEFCGLILDVNNHEKVIGLYVENIHFHMEKSDEEEKALRKVRYFDGEQE